MIHDLYDAASSSKGEVESDGDATARQVRVRERAIAPNSDEGTSNAGGGVNNGKADEDFAAAAAMVEYPCLFFNEIRL